MERHSTSAEFSYDALTGSFQSDLGTLYISNGIDCPSYSSQEGIEWKDGEKFYTSSEVLEKIGTIANFSDLWNEPYEYIPSRWDDEDKEYTQPSSVSYKKEIITRLKELGVEKMKPSTRGRRNKGGRR